MSDDNCTRILTHETHGIFHLWSLRTDTFLLGAQSDFRSSWRESNSIGGTFLTLDVISMLDMRAQGVIHGVCKVISVKSTCSRLLG
jgi:hypothetical protein